MRVTAIAASVIALAAVLGGVTVSADGQETAGQRTAAVAPATHVVLAADAAVPAPRGNNGNG
ncbi:hypothetical protein DMA15_23940 [Streptomyces sp. WAC 01529]|uniref:hypothetical protein n=1 Tax=Streptomyces sp. WAC 01529 TaxID=2203205 RepID=UPI000F6B3B01|nr:hypothetical protein [Streptomyces sp. WAC 01529]AZM55240.1 hypothetical protein DMA15_23940 [Streptomyces sp. WAC 01529]